MHRTCRGLSRSRDALRIFSSSENILCRPRRRGPTGGGTPPGGAGIGSL